MTMDYSARLNGYISKDSIPLYVEAVPKGVHPSRMFHDHDFSEAVLILSGEAQHIIGEKSCTVRAGDVLILHPGIRHAYDRTGNLELINIAYDCRQLSMPILDGYMLPLFHKIFPSGQDTDWEPCAPVIRLDEQEKEAVAAKIFYLQEVLNSTRL